MVFFCGQLAAMFPSEVGAHVFVNSGMGRHVFLLVNSRPY